MMESERLERFKEAILLEYENLEKKDKEFSNRIISFLNNPDITKKCLVDAYYYDFSEIPDHIRVENSLWVDAYLIYGITTKGEIVSKWVKRWDLDSDKEIIDGEVKKD